MSEKALLQIEYSKDFKRDLAKQIDIALMPEFIEVIYYSDNSLCLKNIAITRLKVNGTVFAIAMYAMTWC